MALAGASVCLMLLLVASGPAMATPLADRGDDTLDIDTLAATWHLREDVRALHSEVSAMREEQRKSKGMIQNHFARRLQSNSTSSGSWGDSDDDGGNDDESTHVKDLMRGKHIRVVVKIDPSMTLNMTQEGTPLFRTRDSPLSCSTKWLRKEDSLMSTFAPLWRARAAAGTMLGGTWLCGGMEGSTRICSGLVPS